MKKPGSPVEAKAAKDRDKADKSPEKAVEARDGKSMRFSLSLRKNSIASTTTDAPVPTAPVKGRSLRGRTITDRLAGLALSPRGARADDVTVPAAPLPPESTSPRSRVLLTLAMDAADFGPDADALRAAALGEMRLQSSDRADQRWARMHAQVDQLVAVVLTLLKQLQSARRSGTGTVADAQATTALCVLTARGVLTEMSAGADYMLPILMRCLVDQVRACMLGPDVDGHRAALEACVELALIVRRLKDRSQEQSALLAFLNGLDAPPPLIANPNDPVIQGAVMDAVSQATEFLLSPPQPLQTLSFVPLGTALHDLHKYGYVGSGEWNRVAIVLLQSKAQLLDTAPEAEAHATLVAKIRQLMMDLSQAIAAPPVSTTTETSIDAQSTPQQIVQYLQSLSPPLWPLRALRGLSPSALPSAPALFDLQLVLHSLPVSHLQAWLVLLALPSVSNEIWRACLGPTCSPSDIAALVQCSTHTAAALAFDPATIDPSLRFDPVSHLLTSSSLSALVNLMLKDEYRLLEPRIVEVVLMTHSVFVHSTEFLALLLRYYDAHRADANPLARSLVMDAVGYWFCSPLYLRPDHMTERFVGTWQEYVGALIQAGTIRESEKATFKKFTHLLVAHYGKLEAAAAARAARTPPPNRRRTLKVGASDISMMCHAITKVDWTLFADIQPYELFGNAHMDPLRAPCFARLTKQFNRLTLWVVNAVLELNGSSERAALLQQFIALAQRLWERNNFHGSYAVLCGLNAASVQRLRRSWGKVAKKSSRTFEELMALNSHTRNYKAYRLHVRAATPPMVPQIGIISRDLFGLEENNTDFVAGAPPGEQYVNVAKARMLERIVGEMLAVQGVPYEAIPREAEPLVAFFEDLPDFDERELYQRSLVLEPREEGV